jgi:hypothetical protein
MAEREGWRKLNSMGKYCIVSPKGVWGWGGGKERIVEKTYAARKEQMNGMVRSLSSTVLLPAFVTGRHGTVSSHLPYSLPKKTYTAKLFFMLSLPGGIEVSKLP